jgi:cob(I)alamin adenosyltransferase
MVLVYFEPMGTKIYTKTGDKGTTSLLGGTKVSKADPRIDAYGNVDELNSFIGYLKDQDEISRAITEQLYWVQDRLFVIGSILASAPGFQGFNLPQIVENDVKKLENWIDQHQAELPELRNFILPGGHKVVSLSHVCRSVCRRTERGVAALAAHGEIDAQTIAFLNRLSDYLFVLARKMAHDLGVAETPWTPEK